MSRHHTVTWKLNTKHNDFTIIVRLAWDDMHRVAWQQKMYRHGNTHCCPGNILCRPGNVPSSPGNIRTWFSWQHTLFSWSPMPKSVQACSTNMSYSLKDPLSKRTSTRSLAVSFPCSKYELASWRDRIPTHPLTVLCCFSILFSPPPFKALCLFSSSVPATPSEYARPHPLTKQGKGRKILQLLLRADIFSDEVKGQNGCGFRVETETKEVNKDFFG